MEYTHECMGKVRVFDYSTYINTLLHTTGEFGVVYKAHLVTSMQQMPAVVAVKTLKGQ